MKMFEIYSYMYYRLATWYFKYEKKGKISYGASILVSLSQVMIITDIFGIVFLELFNKTEGQLFIDKIKPYYIVSIILIAFVNDFKYMNKYEVLDKKWGNISRKEKNLYGVYIFLLLVIPIVFIPIILNVFDYSK